MQYTDYKVHASNRKKTTIGNTVSNTRIVYKYIVLLIHELLHMNKYVISDLVYTYKDARNSNVTKLRIWLQKQIYDDHRFKPMVFIEHWKQFALNHHVQILQTDWLVLHQTFSTYWFCRLFLTHFLRLNRYCSSFQRELIRSLKHLIL